MVQYMKTYQHNSFKQTDRKESHDHFFLDAEKASDQIQNPFMLRVLERSMMHR